MAQKDDFDDSEIDINDAEGGDAEFGDDAAPAPKKSGGMLFKAVVVLLVLGGGGAFYYFKMMGGQIPGLQTAQAPAIAPVDASVPAGIPAPGTDMTTDMAANMAGADPAMAPDAFQDVTGVEGAPALPGDMPPVTPDAPMAVTLPGDGAMAGAPDISVPGMEVPSIAAPDMGGTDMAATDMAGTDMSAPDMGTTDAGAADMAAPESWDNAVPAPADATALDPALDPAMPADMTADAGISAPDTVTPAIEPAVTPSATPALTAQGLPAENVTSEIKQALPATNDAAVAALEARVAALETTLQDMHASLASKDDLTSLRTLIERTAAQAAASSAVAAAPKKAAAKSVPDESVAVDAARNEVESYRGGSKRSPAKATAEKKMNWVLKSAKPGTAWIAQNGSAELKTVSVGDTVPGLGKITAIALDSSGKWVVNGTKGRVNQ